MIRWIVRSLKVLAIVLVLLYAGDWAILRMRIAHGTAFRVIQVHQLLATP